MGKNYKGISAFGCIYQWSRYECANRGLLAEIHQRLALEEVCEELRINNLVEFDPIEDGQRIDHFVFRYSQEGGMLVCGDDGNMHAEIDEIVLVDGLPTVFEMKTGRYENDKNRQAMSSERLRKVLEYVARLFNRNVGYVLHIPWDQLDRTLPEQEEFRRKGGLLAAFYETRDRYYGRVLPEIRRQFGI